MTPLEAKPLGVIMKISLLFIAFVWALSGCSQDVSQNEIANPGANSQAGIYGGDEVGASDIIARTTVVLYNLTEGYLCTGSLYGQNMVITASHCLVGDPTHLEVRFGVDMRAPVMVRQVISGKAKIPFTGKIYQNLGDIALLKYEGTIPSGYGFRSVNLLTDYSVLKRGTPVIAAGFGIKGPTLGNGAGVLRKVALEVKNPAYSRTEIILKQGLFKGVCSGDSGGPAFVKGTDGKLYLWGVTSNVLGIPKVRACITRSIFTRVDVYANWLKETAQGL